MAQQTNMTAVEWLADKVTDMIHESNHIELVSLLEQAKEMEKEQIIDAYVEGFDISAEGWNGEYGIIDFKNIKEEISAEQYYNEKYGK